MAPTFLKYKRQVSPPAREITTPFSLKDESVVELHFTVHHGHLT